MKNERFNAVSRNIVAIFAAAPAAAMAQTQNDPTLFEDEVVVVGEAPRGVVFGDITPEITLDARDIRSYGVSSIAELLEELSAQTSSRSGRGAQQPVILLNGRRTTGRREIRRYPPEAIRRVEILPEEVALKYGLRADQKVVNIVLRERFRSLTTQVEGGGATEGGFVEGEFSGNQLTIRDDRRWSVDLEYDRNTQLLESERAVIDSDQRLNDVIGNVTSLPAGDEIDPALSALAGAPLTIAGAPPSAVAAPPSLADFASGETNETDTTPFRSLRPKSDTISIAGVLHDVFFGDVATTLTAGVDYSKSIEALGLARADFSLPASNVFSPFANDVLVARYFDPSGQLRRETESLDSNFNAALNGAKSGATWSLITKYERSETTTLTDRDADTGSLQAAIDASDANPFAPLSTSDFPIETDLAETVTHNGVVEALVSGSPLNLPAGAITTTLKIGGELTRLHATSQTEDLSLDTRLERDEANAQFNIDLPILAQGATPAPIGNLTLSGNARVDYLSDFDVLRTVGYNVNWRPIPEVQVLVSGTYEEGAPSIQQLGDPLITTPNLRVFDFALGETVEDVTRLRGGNENLLNDDRRVFRVNLNIDPFEETNLSFSASYTDQRIDNAITSFPSLTPNIEAAFPERFIRDGTGALVTIDARPVNYAQTQTRDLRYGFNWSMRLAETPPELTQEEREQLMSIMRRNRPTNANAGASRGRGPGGGRGRSSGRLYFSTYHTFALEDSVLISEGSQRLDLLDGDAVTASGGAARHSIESRLGFSHSGYGARARFEWQSGTAIDNGASGDLRFEDIGVIDLRVFVDLSRQRSLLLKYPFLAGSRLSIDVQNLLNDRQRVTDAMGETPLGFQPELIDPIGRTISIRYRKLFF